MKIVKINKESLFDKNFFRTKLFFYTAGLFIVFLLIFIYTFFIPNNWDKDGTVSLRVEKGEPLIKVIEELHQKEIIPSKINMRISALLYGAENKVKAGTYTIPQSISYLGLTRLLVKGQPEPQKLVTIQEGIWQFELAGLLKKELGLDSAKVMELSKDKNFLSKLNVDAKSLEGYLLPETYYFFIDISEAETLEKLKNAMDDFFTDSMKTQMQKLGMTKHEILTMASIIDGETNIASEFKTISGVYHNRLKIGMALQADPTVQYLVRKKNQKKVYFKDLEIDSPFNTYLYPGLPPAPINNPGKGAILAALFPEEHKYLYFVADGTGGHHFAKSYNEHVRNVQKYREWRRNQ